jgi:hypothetical protein
MGREARGKERTPTRKRKREIEEGSGNALKPPSRDVVGNMQRFNQGQDQMRGAATRRQNTRVTLPLLPAGRHSHVGGAAQRRAFSPTGGLAARVFLERERLAHYTSPCCYTLVALLKNTVFNEVRGLVHGASPL